MHNAAINIEPTSAGMLAPALDYAQRGWHVFPCWPGDKTPCVGADKDDHGNKIPKTGGLYKATTDEAQITTWWRRWPNAMIGVRMGEASGVWAIDPDAPKDASRPDGRAAWGRLTAQHGAVHTHAHLTPGGGQHILFKWDPNRPIGNKEGMLKGTGINVRGEGGYVIAPPSINSEGRFYEVVEPLDYFHFADAPDWLYELILTPSISERAAARVERPAPRADRRPYANAALRSESDELAGCGNGDRNNQLNKAAFKLGTLVGAGELSEGEVTGALFDAATACGLLADDGQRAVMATINSGLQEGIKHPREIPEREQRKHANEQQAASKAGKPEGAQVIEIHWHGKYKDRAPRSWLAKNLVPETGCGLLSGQWGTAKTFTALDLCACTITGLSFAGREMTRKGGVLFIAAEGASEIPIRLQGVVDHKLAPMKAAAAAAGNPIDTDLEALPFGHIEECPNLKEGFERIVQASLTSASHLEEQFDLPLALIIIDTLSAAAEFKDGNDAAEGQFIMNRLNELSRRTGAFVLAVDHFGKAVETGTRGTSAKEAAADMVLALLADREVSGAISNTRMAVRKLRGGSVGAETPFDLKVVDLGDGEETCIIEWRSQQSTQKKETSTKDRWSPSLRIFKAALLTALTEHGKLMHPYGTEGSAVRAVAYADVRREFMAAYPADAGDDAGKDDAKRKALQRALKGARERDLIGSREIGGVDHLWLVEADKSDVQPSTKWDGQDTP